MSEIRDPADTTLDPKLQSLLENTTEPDDKGYIYCATCSHIITRAVERTQINASHEHYCTNPHGFEFHVGCFSEALGCDILGDAQAADSWFMGYAWRLAACAQCHTHLGWYFTHNSTDSYFYGLILDRIQQD